jgi:hypothetical protein
VEALTGGSCRNACRRCHGLFILMAEHPESGDGFRLRQPLAKDADGGHHNTSTRRCPLGGRVRRCCPRLARLDRQFVPNLATSTTWSLRFWICRAKAARDRAVASTSRSSTTAYRYTYEVRVSPSAESAKRRSPPSSARPALEFARAVLRQLGPCAWGSARRGPNAFEETDIKGAGSFRPQSSNHRS